MDTPGTDGCWIKHIERFQISGNILRLHRQNTSSSNYTRGQWWHHALISPVFACPGAFLVSSKDTYAWFRMTLRRLSPLCANSLRCPRSDTHTHTHNLNTCVQRYVTWSQHPVPSLYCCHFLVRLQSWFRSPLSLQLQLGWTNSDCGVFDCILQADGDDTTGTGYDSGENEEYRCHRSDTQRTSRKTCDSYLFCTAYTVPVWNRYTERSLHYVNGINAC